MRSVIAMVILGCCVLAASAQPGLAGSAAGTAAADSAGIPGVQPAPGASPTSSTVTPAGDDTPADVRLVFGFTAGTVLVLFALAFLDRRPEP